jgi:DNA-directed RNA polymerase subunit N (RpoN/RPB10)
MLCATYFLINKYDNRIFSFSISFRDSIINPNILMKWIEYEKALQELDTIRLQGNHSPETIYKILNIKRFCKERIYILTKEKWKDLNKYLKEI